MSAIRRIVRHWAEQVEAERTPVPTFTITTATGTSGPFPGHHAI